MTSVLVVLGGYVLGSMPFGYWVVRLVKGEDIRKVGSGNIGASNVWRTYGRWLGIPIVLLGVAIWIVAFVLSRYASLASIVAALSLPVLAVLLGERWPIIVFGALASLGVVLLHRANIGRLRAGTESRFRLRRA